MGWVGEWMDAEVVEEGEWAAAEERVEWEWEWD